MPAIFLIGFMGCGKTTLGKAVAKVTGLPFIDLDSYIERREGSTISRLFELHGEEGFRAIESRRLREVAENDDAIVACGGGTPCFAGNMELMLGAGKVVWLDATIPRLVERLAVGRRRRPLIAALTDAQLAEYVVEALDRRRCHYSRAHLRFDSSRLDTRRQIDESVASFLSLLNIEKSPSADNNPSS